MASDLELAISKWNQGDVSASYRALRKFMSTSPDSTGALLAAGAPREMMAAFCRVTSDDGVKYILELVPPRE